jgi:hypothetical protein
VKRQVAGGGGPCNGDCMAEPLRRAAETVDRRLPPQHRRALGLAGPWRRELYGDAGGSDIQKFHIPSVVIWVVELSPGLCCGLTPVVVQKITG